MPRAKASVRTVPAWGERKAVGGAVGQATPVRPVRGTGQTGAKLNRQQFGLRARTDARFGFGGLGSSGWAEEFVGGRVARCSPLLLNTGMGGVVVLSLRGGTVHGFPFLVLVILQLERASSLVVVFIEVA
jgi:hypothetical protein